MSETTRGFKIGRGGVPQDFAGVGGEIEPYRAKS